MLTTKRWSRLVLRVSALVLAVLCSRAVAQTSPGQVTILVTDDTGRAVPNASLKLTQTNVEKTFTSDAEGKAQAGDLAAGEWLLTIKAEGYAERQRPVVVQVDPVSLSIALEKTVMQLRVNVESEVTDQALRLNSAATGGTNLNIPVRDLPATLTIISQELIQERGIGNSLEALELAPGVTTWNDTGWIPAADSRGFSTTDAGNQMLLDGFRQNSVPQSGRFMDTFNFERIEVLKGPASLLYGEGAIGTTINYVSKRPKKELSFDSLLSYGSFGQSRVGLGANVPLKDNLSARFDVSYSNGGGYVNRTGSRMRSMNGQVHWTPLHNLAIDAMGVYSDDWVRAYYGTPLSSTPYDPNGQYVRLSATSYLDRRMLFKDYNIQDELNKSNNNRGRIDADLTLPAGWTVRNSFGVSTHRLDNRDFEGYGFDNTAKRVTVNGYFLAKRDDILVTEEVQARKAFRVFGRSVSFMTSGSISDSNMHRWSTPAGAPTYSLDPLNPAPLVDPGLPYVKNRDVYTVTKALYAETQIRLTEKLTLIGGGRIDRISNHRFDDATRLNTFKIYRPQTGRVGLVYALNSSVSAYISNNHSVQPTTPLISLTAAQVSFSLQPGRAWEGGVKGSLFRERLDLNLAIFSENRKNMLTQTVVDGVRLQQQIGEQMSQGYEFSFSGRLRRMFALQGDLAYTNAEYVDFNENLGTGVVSRAGNDVPHTPAVVWNLTPLVRFGPFTVSSTVRNQGARWRDRANTIRLHPYTLLSANVSVRLPRGARLTLTGRNLTDELYAGRSNSESIVRFGAPRNYSMQLTKTF